MFETTSQFFFKLCITIQCHERQLFCTFLAETVDDLDKRSPEKFQTFDCSYKVSPNLYFDKILLLKVYKISAKKNAEELCLMTLKSDAKFEEKLTSCLKNDKNLVNFDPSTQKSKNLRF